MAYGLTINGQNGSYQIDSNTTETIYHSVISSGTVDGSSTRATITASQTTDLVWINRTDTGATHNGWNTVGAPIKYVVTRRTNALTSFTGTYGLQIKNASGDLIFDSRGITEGVNVINRIPIWTLCGTATTAGLNDTQQQLGSTTKSTIVYSGSPTNIYVTTQGALASWVSGSQDYMEYHFDYTNNKIKLLNYFSGYGGGYSFFENYAPIMVGTLQT